MDYLQQTLDSYLSSREVTAEYRRHLQRMASKMRGVGVTLHEEPEELAGKINVVLRSFGHMTTRANYRRVAVTLLRHRLGGSSESVVHHLLRVKQKNLPPVAYTMEEVERLLKCADNLPDEFACSGCPRGRWAGAFVLLCYETGFRFQDALDLEVRNLRGNRLSIVVSKTQRFLHKRLSADLCSRLAWLAEHGDGESFFAWAVTKRYACRWLRMAWKESRLPGSCRWLRRTGATLVEAQQPGSAAEFLGHSPNSHGLAARCYIDQSLLPDRCPSPPTISVGPPAGRAAPCSVHRRASKASR